jgi:hypothetical protein
MLPRSFMSPYPHVFFLSLFILCRLFPVWSARLRFRKKPKPILSLISFGNESLKVSQAVFAFYPGTPLRQRKLYVSNYRWK